MHSMQRPEVFFSVHRLLPGFELQTSNVPKQQMEDAGKSAYTGEVTASNAQHYKLVHRRIGVHRRIDYHQSAYQIPTFNTTDWYTGEAAYTGESATGESPYQIPTFNTTDWYTGEAAYRRPANRRPASRRIRFQRSTQQIGTPVKRRTGDRRPASRRIRFQRFNTTDWYTGEAAYRRPATGESPYQTSNCWRRQNRSTQIGPTSKHWWRPSVNPLLSTVTAGVDRPCFQLDAFVDHSVRTTSKTAYRNWKRAVLL